MRCAASAVEYALNLLRALPPPVLSMLRLFFALQPAPRAERRARREPRAARRCSCGSQPVPAANLHATLCFIGAVARRRLDALARRRRERARPASEVEFRRVRVSGRSRRSCARRRSRESSCGEPSLSIALGEAAVAAGFSPDIKPFRAHLTLARKDPRRRRAKRSVAAALVAADSSMRCEQFVLMESRRERGGLDIQCRRFVATVSQLRIIQ